MTNAKSRGFFNIFSILTLFLFFFLLKSPVEASLSVTEGLKICFSKAIPSLFPFLVLNELMLSSGLTRSIGQSFGGIFSKLFNVQKETAVCFIYGCLFGFPLGTRAVCSLYEKNVITKDEAQRAICFCSNTGPSFVIGVVGVSLCSPKIGICIYISQLLSAIIIGISLRSGSTPCCPILNEETKPNKSFSIIKAITDSIIPTLNICAFICFFSCISGAVDNLLSSIGISEYASFFISGFLEITNGIHISESYGASFFTIFFCAFFVGWSGISVILQSLSFTAKAKLDSKKFILSKLAQGVICALICFILCKIFKLY